MAGEPDVERFLIQLPIPRRSMMEMHSRVGVELPGVELPGVVLAAADAEAHAVAARKPPSQHLRVH